MEYCMEAIALKSSLRRELATKQTQQGFCEDFLFLNAPIHGPTGLVSVEDFSIDCFLDFSSSNCDEFKDSSPNYVQDQEIAEEEEEEEEEEEKDFLSVSSSQDRVDEDNNSNSSSFMSDSLLTTELAVPDDDLAELEWVSHFVDDSLSEVSLLVPAYKEKTESHAQTRFEPEPEPTLSKISAFFPTWVPSRARTKRPRPTGRNWSVGYSVTETSSLSSTSSNSSIPCILSTNTVQTIDSFPGLTEPTMKKQKKRPAVQTDGMMGLTQFQRRCSHCQVQKTPQWRTGPLGAKTLCNACGVRYKSGRLFPEYRPACSPTFSSEVHSNSHRKVLEMRRKKEVVGQESGLNQMVRSF